MANAIQPAHPSAGRSRATTAGKSARTEAAGAFEKTLSQVNDASHADEQSKAARQAQPAARKTARSSKSRKADAGKPEQNAPADRVAKRKSVAPTGPNEADAPEGTDAAPEAASADAAAKAEEAKRPPDHADVAAIDLATPAPMHAKLALGGEAPGDGGADGERAASIEAVKVDGSGVSASPEAPVGSGDEPTAALAEASVGEAFDKVLHELGAAGSAASATDAAAASGTSTVQPQSANHAAPHALPDAQALPPRDSAFAETNHARVVSAIRTQLLPNGGSMHIRLDPPELGALQVRVEMRDGVMSASFQTSNDEATRLLSHSLGQLKQTLEAHGMSVEKLQVQQAPKDEFARTREDGSGQQQPQDSSHQQEQQRREMLQRMWRRLSQGRDPLDLVA